MHTASPEARPKRGSQARSPNLEQLPHNFGDLGCPPLSYHVQSLPASSAAATLSDLHDAQSLSAIHMASHHYCSCVAAVEDMRAILDDGSHECCPNLWSAEAIRTGTCKARGVKNLSIVYLRLTL